MRLTLIMIAAASFMLAACGGSSEGPEAVAKKFITHVNNLEFDQAKAYGTKSTNDILDMISGLAGAMGDEGKPEDTSFEIIEVKEEGDTATVVYQNASAEEPETLSLVKQDGKWLVDINKEDMDKEDDGEGLGDIDWEEELEDIGEDAGASIDGAIDSLEQTIDEVEAEIAE